MFVEQGRTATKAAVPAIPGFVRIKGDLTEQNKKRKWHV